MGPVDPGSAREFLEASIAAFSVLGGAITYFSGYYAARAIAQEQPPEAVGAWVNRGIARGFAFGAPASIVALLIVVLD